ncbi:hypothetical protein FRB96_005201 [Tulasnella sp. 330]|nr:hypothetical protein FRB96_005201 [Tulasnella sp. 330]
MEYISYTPDLKDLKAAGLTCKALRESVNDVMNRLPVSHHAKPQDYVPPKRSVKCVVFDDKGVDDEFLNPGKFTLQGTNTYLIGAKPPWILIDTGEGHSEYTEILRNALREEAGADPSRGAGSLGGLISDILITHRHHDHHGGLPSVLHLLQSPDQSQALPLSGDCPKLHKFPLPERQPQSKDPVFVHLSTSEGDTSLQVLHEALSKQEEHYKMSSSDHQQHPYFHDLKDGQTLKTLDGSATLRVIHTPGHTADSISLYLVEERTLFTADTVLGHGTAVFEDLGAYMASLHRMRDVWVQDKGQVSDESAPGRVFPGHGAVVKDGRALIEEYIAHRQEREDQILELMRPLQVEGIAEAHYTRSENPWTVEEIVRKLYASYPPSLWPAAGHGVILHLLKLKGEGKVQRVEESNQSIELAQQKWLVIA